MENTTFVKTDAGRIEKGFPQEKNDCTVRAFSLAKDMPYHEVHKLFALAGRKDGDGMFQAQMVPLLERNGFKITFERMTLGRFLKANPKGNFFVVKRGHAFAVKNGIVFDMFPIGPRTKVIFFAKVLEK